MGGEKEAAASVDLRAALGFSGDGEGLDAPLFGVDGEGEGVDEEEKKAVIWLCFRTSGERPLLARRDAIAEGGATTPLLRGFRVLAFCGGIARGRGLLVGVGGKGRRAGRVGGGNGAEKWRETEAGEDGEG